MIGCYKIKENVELRTNYLFTCRNLVHRDFPEKPIITMAGDKAVTVAAKPQMRGMLQASIKRNLIVALTLAAISGVAFKQLIGTERKRKYAEFYRTYDAEKEFEEMKKKGLFQSC